MTCLDLQHRVLFHSSEINFPCNNNDGESDKNKKIY